MSELLLTAAQMRALEQAAIASGEVTGLELMERAGQGAVEAILAEWPEMGTGSRAVVLCGPGNNGGDGFVVARLLAERGWAVDCSLYGDAARLPPDAKANHARWSRLGRTYPIPDGEQDDPIPGDRPDLWIDAIFGIGQSRALPEAVTALMQRIHDEPDLSAAPVVALDIPTGLSSDTGRTVQPVLLTASLTVTFHGFKPGHVLGEGPERCGRVRTVDIGLDRVPRGPALRAVGQIAGLGAEAAPSEGLRTVAELVGPPPETIEKRSGHKFDHGHVLVLAGGVGRGGAARLSARAALRIGAGLVTLAPPPSALIENACRLDAVMLRRMPDAETLAETLADDRITALCLGPGLGTGAREAALVARAVSSGRPAVYDADALTLLAKDAGMRAGLHADCVLTPHMGEFARLAPDLAEKLDAPGASGAGWSKIDAARDLAARFGCTVLLKGPDTVIADAAGRAAVHAGVHDRAAPWLATAGAGDVLAGIIAGLLARGLDPMAACKAAVWLHVEAARAFGPGLIAEDLPEMLPRVLRDLES